MAVTDLNAHQKSANMVVGRQRATLRTRDRVPSLLLLPPSQAYRPSSIHLQRIHPICPEAWIAIGPRILLLWQWHQPLAMTIATTHLPTHPLAEHLKHQPCHKVFVVPVNPTRHRHHR
jgi:hypothetical protein